MELAEMVKAKARSMGRSAPQTSAPASVEVKEASGISQGVRSDKKPLKRTVSGKAIWRTEGK